MNHHGTPYAEPARNGWAFVLPEAEGFVSLALVPSRFSTTIPLCVTRYGTLAAELHLPTGRSDVALRVRIDCRAPGRSSLQRGMHRQLNGRRSELAIGGMIVLLAVCGFIIGGEEGARRAVVCGSLNPDDLAITPKAMARRFGAKLLQPADAPLLFIRLSEISRRAGLRRSPDLYYLPAPDSMNAYALGGAHNAAIVVTDGLLHRMSHDEVAGILAHEVAHIANNDRVAMSFATSLQQALAMTALAGLAARPGSSPANASLAAFLAIAPAIGHLLFLSLSRSRELDADARALDLIDHPHALVSALGKLEQFHSPVPSGVMQAVEDGMTHLLRSHPATSERVRLLQLAS